MVPPTGDSSLIGAPPGPLTTPIVSGSEGTLGLLTEITVKLTRLPESVKTLLAIFDTLDDTTETVVDITARGITPAACEMLDGYTLRAVEAYVHAGFPIDSAAVLLIDVDGVREGVESQAEEVAEICRAHHAREVRMAKDSRERDLLWKGRKNAFGAVGRLSTTYYVQDGVIPRTRLSEVLGRIRALERRSGLRIGNVFHAGDGNLHPLICYDEEIPGQGDLAEQVGAEILTYCIEAGGSITGEHGVGADKSAYLSKMFSEDDLDTMQMVRCAFN
jgi:glycolate oxidase